MTRPQCFFSLPWAVIVLTLVLAVSTAAVHADAATQGAGQGTGQQPVPWNSQSPQTMRMMPTTPPHLPAIAPGQLQPAMPQARQAPQDDTNGKMAGMPEIDLSWKGYFEALALLCFALAVILGALWLFKRLTRGDGVFSKSTQGLRIESRLALGAKKWLIVVRYMDRRLVLGMTDERISLLSEIPIIPEPDITLLENTANPVSSQNNGNTSETDLFTAILNKTKNM